MPATHAPETGTSALGPGQKCPPSGTEVPYIRDTTENNHIPHHTRLAEDANSESGTVTTAVLPEGGTLHPSHVAVRRLLDELGKQGLSARKIMHHLRRAFPDEYERTYRHWRSKCSNAPTQWHHVDDDFKSFPHFVYELGWKPVGNQPYEIHRKDPLLGYSLTNCVWLDKSTNLKLRGRAEEARAYAKAYKVSKRTAYRHLEKTQEPVDFARRDLIERAKEFHKNFYVHLKTRYPGTITIIPQPTQAKLNQIANLLKRYWGFLDDEKLHFIVNRWERFNERLGCQYDVWLYEKPALIQLLRKFEFIFQEYSYVYEEAKTPEGDFQVYEFTKAGAEEVFDDLLNRRIAEMIEKGELIRV